MTLLTPSQHTKHYTTPERCQTAVRHYAWLTQHATPMRLPELRAIGPTSLVFDFVNGRHAQPTDLPRLAAHLGDVHGAAWVNDLHRARLDTPHTPGEGLALADHPTSRQRGLSARHAAGFIPTQEALNSAQALLARKRAARLPLQADGRPVVLDFEHARPDARVRDFARLEHRHWSHRPHLREAFFTGYGHTLTDTEHQLPHLFGAVEAITALVRGQETGDPALHAHGRTILTHLL